MTATENQSDLVARKPGAVERTFGPLTPEELPLALGSAMMDLAKLAQMMHPDDVSLSLDVFSGILTFRAYKRERG
jgi:hypothetical protein